MTVEVYQEPWNKKAADVLRPAFGGDENIIRAQVETGECELFHLPGAGYFITRIEVYPDYSELVVVALAGERMLHLLDVAKTIKDVGGVDRVRIHTERPGFFKLLAEIGFTETERVFHYG